MKKTKGKKLMPKIGLPLRMKRPDLPPEVADLGEMLQDAGFTVVFGADAVRELIEEMKEEK